MKAVLLSLGFSLVFQLNGCIEPDAELKLQKSQKLELQEEALQLKTTKKKDDLEVVESLTLTEPITVIKKLGLTKDGFKDASAKKPIVIKSEKDAKKYFDEKSLAIVTKSVDFEKRHLVVFAWRGSGKDQMTHVVMESYPEQVAFTLKRGRTRDLRQHVGVYSIRNNVKWSVR